MQIPGANPSLLKMMSIMKSSEYIRVRLMMNGIFYNKHKFHDHEKFKTLIITNVYGRVFPQAALWYGYVRKRLSAIRLVMMAR